MKKDYTHLSIVLDRSGSMATIRTDAEGGLAEFLRKQKEVPGKYTVTVAKFDDIYELTHDMVPLSELPAIKLDPRGATALLDAVGKAINTTGQRLAAMSEDERPEHVFFVIVTDGQENASHEFQKDQIRKMIEEQSNQWKWHFVYLGANVDAFAEASSMGIARGGTIAYAAASAGVQNVYTATADNVNRVRTRAAASMGFTNEEREEAMKED